MSRTLSLSDFFVSCSSFSSPSSPPPQMVVKKKHKQVIETIDTSKKTIENKKEEVESNQQSNNNKDDSDVIEDINTADPSDYRFIIDDDYRALAKKLLANPPPPNLPKGLQPYELNGAEKSSVSRLRAAFNMWMQNLNDYTNGSEVFARMYKKHHILIQSNTSLNMETRVATVPKPPQIHSFLKFTRYGDCLNFLFYIRYPRGFIDDKGHWQIDEERKGEFVDTWVKIDDVKGGFGIINPYLCPRRFLDVIPDKDLKQQQTVIHPPITCIRYKEYPIQDMIDVNMECIERSKKGDDSILIESAKF